LVATRDGVFLDQRGRKGIATHFDEPTPHSDR